MFGVDTLDEVHSRVKLAYLPYLYTILTGKEIAKPELSGANILRKVNRITSQFMHGLGEMFPVAKAIGSVFSINGLDMITVKNPEDKNKRKPLLVFDDLERCNLGIQNLLGAINEYVETNGIRTILVANEDVIVMSSGQSRSQHGEGDRSASNEHNAYEKLKEKVICRTVKHVPNYHNIVHRIVDSFVESIGGYKTFMRSHVDLIESVFRDSLTNNIRSLKNSLQDFERVYSMIIEEGIEVGYCANFMTAFLVLDFESRDGLLIADKYNGLFVDQKYMDKYKDLNRAYVLNTCRVWLASGDWVQGDLAEELREFKRRIAGSAPVETILSIPTLYVDDDVFVDGFEQMIRLAYSGELRLDGYMSLLKIFICAQRHGICLPVAIEWPDVKEGLSTKLNRDWEDYKSKSDQRVFLNSTEEDMLQETPLEIFCMINDFRSREPYKRSRHKFLSALNNSSHREILTDMKTKHLGLLDREIAKAVGEYYIKSSNADKTVFQSAFCELWRPMPKDDVELVATREGLIELLHVIKPNMSTKSIGGAIDREFVKIIEELLEECSIQNDEEPQ